MIRLLRAVALAAVASAPVLARPLAAQRPGGPAFGFVVGLGRVPSAQESYCGQPVAWHARGVLAEARAALPLGHHLSLEGRISAQNKVDLRTCGGIYPTVPDGTYASRAYRLRGDGFAGTDLRLRYDVPRLPVVLMAGAGQLWGLRAPYVALGPGLRLGGRVRLILDGDALLARVPCDDLLTQWRGGVPVAVLSRVRSGEWRAVGGLRLGVELRLR